MRKEIKAQIDGLDYKTRLRVLDTIKALDNGKGQSIEFNSDGSGVCFTYWSPTINHGCPRNGRPVIQYGRRRPDSGRTSL